MQCGLIWVKGKNRELVEDIKGFMRRPLSQLIMELVVLVVVVV